MQVAVDSPILVALLDPRDHWRDRSLALERALPDAGMAPIYFDCVAAEAVSAAARRLRDKGRGGDVPGLLHTVDEQWVRLAAHPHINLARARTAATTTRCVSAPLLTRS